MYVERVIGTIRRECLDHVIVFHQTSLSRHLRSFLDYYHHNRCHLALEKETPEPRPVQPPKQGRVISVPHVGGLHRRYERRVNNSESSSGRATGGTALSLRPGPPTSLPSVPRQTLLLSGIPDSFENSSQVDGRPIIEADVLPADLIYENDSVQ
jgi:hypothetical protein